jgi:hypothetical protein
MVKLDFSKVPRIRLWSVLEEEELPIQSLELGSTTNTEPTGDKIHIPRELIGNWSDSDTDPFPDYQGIKAYAQADACWTVLDAHIRNEDYPRIVTTHPWPINSETMLEVMLKTHFDSVNLALERTHDGNDRHLMIAGGKSATAGDDVGISSEPDRASFIAPTHIFQGDEDAPESLLVYCFSNLNNKGAKDIQNLVPGEIKLWYKFRHEFLDATIVTADGSVKPDRPKRQQAEQVFTQIYQYMNERQSAIGYLITDQELICVRRIRKERFGIRYGVIDVTHPIPLSVKRGNLNAKMALWYLHHKYAVKDIGSCFLRETPKPNLWPEIVDAIRVGRRSHGRFGLRKRRSTVKVDLEDIGEKEYASAEEVEEEEAEEEAEAAPNLVTKYAKQKGKGKGKGRKR